MRFVTRPILDYSPPVWATSGVAFGAQLNEHVLKSTDSTLPSGGQLESAEEQSYLWGDVAFGGSLRDGA
ncbi:hypothetical protein N7530_010632 [Penicillium desertorum]|uniref:Uncharacterized protein n=1 Tax=Penicillium desertorum TaxID=1303715 RepID=A0A9X0BI05_9EURO|nr:hypothetical protein N7530_010632 [Penicillium desertorum]